MASQRGNDGGRGFFRDNSLSLLFLTLFVLTLIGQAIAGHAEYNSDEMAHHGETISMARYLTSSSFGQAVMENWQSEYLQFTLFLMATVWFIQRGSPESKEPGKEGKESDEDQKVGSAADQDSPLWARAGGVRQAVYSNSLLIAMAAIWLASWVAQSLAGWSAYNADQAEHHEERLSWLGYIGSSDFWQTTLQNWQSELLAVGSFAVFAIYLRQRGSSQSKPVGSPHHATGVEG